MKIDCGPTRADKDKIYINKRLKRMEWQKWFDWYPVRIASHDCRWFETIERKYKFEMSYYNCTGFWEYRAISIPKYLGGK